MITPKKLIKMARKWKRLAAKSRKRITFPRTSGSVDASNCNSSTVDEGHFVVYTADQRRFVVPLAYLRNGILKELLRMAAEEYGLPSHGPITLPCDHVFLKYAVSLIRRQADKHLENAVIMTITSAQCLSTSCLQQEQSNKHPLICSF
ncbi:auxin-responsive protein SAUR67-like [Diospyros lotus]|uniref:auxin-responsive protein SAUR67-like n=1 Tax=Diospyros lotus TaxID=55363 RepID=UPI002253DAC4|nr:auxin-responsive protein SAUR67-like [Diospyros lotus]XP_052193881.1 auxin-responsive protein SAUR67-like [Diospyros lotus]